MKYLSEYRDPALVRRLVDEIEACATRPWTIMEVCGGQTHAIVKYGLDALLPGVEMVHGPGCPVCVTPTAVIDQALEIAARPDVIFASFGDMLRVPGSEDDLIGVKARGGDVRVVYAPLDAVDLAERNPGKTVVFFAIGFETTAPANALAVRQAERRGVENFAVLVSHVLVPPVVEGILRDPERRVQGLLGPGHVCAVEGAGPYRRLARDTRTPIVITGFEPADLLRGILLTLRQLEDGRAELENGYPRAVSEEGNAAARALVDAVFERCDQEWRGLGLIPSSGLRLRPELRARDARRRFAIEARAARDCERCISGEVLRGLKKPVDCPAFGNDCTPSTPLGATMVSSEGACAAYFAYRRSGLESA